MDTAIEPAEPRHHHHRRHHRRPRHKHVSRRMVYLWCFVDSLTATASFYGSVLFSRMLDNPAWTFAPIAYPLVTVLSFLAFFGAFKMTHRKKSDAQLFGMLVVAVAFFPLAALLSHLLTRF